MPSSRRAFAQAVLLLAALPAHAMPSTFNTVIGNALLCRSHLDNRYFYDYLTTAFGPDSRCSASPLWHWPWP